MGFNSGFKGLKYIGVLNLVVWLHMSLLVYYCIPVGKEPEGDL